MGQNNSNILSDTTVFCENGNMVIDISNQINESATFFWTTPTEIITNTKKITVSKQGFYFLKVVSKAYPYILYDSTYVIIYSKFKLRIKDTSICKGKSIFLESKYGHVNYLWNTNETTQKIKISNPGLYWVKIKIANCTFTDTVKVKLAEIENILYDREALFCVSDENKKISIKVKQGTNILWETGAKSSSITVSKQGNYWVKTYGGTCSERVDTINVKFKICDCEMIIPNSFTPNEDNQNDSFSPVLQCDYVRLIMTITDRWGNTVFSSSSLNSKWDGRFKGNLCPEDIYIYKIESTEKLSEKKMIRSGRISLFR